MRIPKRLRNYGLWLAVAALVGMVLQDVGVNIAPDRYQAYVDAVLTILVLAGIINNPSQGTGYRDE